MTGAKNLRLPPGRKASGPYCGKWIFVFLSLLLLLLGEERAPTSALVSEVTITKSVYPTRVAPGSRLTYNITLTNATLQGANDLEVSDLLPAGFRYVAGSTRVYSNHALVSTADPVVVGQMVSWRGLPLPAARQGAYYGIHTFIQDRCDSDYINYQLDRALELMGPGAFVKQLFYRVTPELAGPLPCWVDFVNRAYDRGLVPVVRLQGVHGGPYWLKPEPDSPGNYTTIAQAYKRVVQGLPRRDGQRLYVEIWNEPNLDIEWSGAPNPVEYAEFLVDVAAAIRSIGDSRIVILNGGLSPGGNYHNLAFIDAMATVPGAMDAFDVWSAHPYPGNHPPQYNNHDGSATYHDLTIDSYLLELERLAAHGRKNVQVILTETGYALGQNNFWFEGYPPITEQNRADYILRAFRDYWRYWPELLGVCPYELVDPRGDWWVWDWLYPDGQHHEQYDAIAGLPKTGPLAPSHVTIEFQAIAASISGTYYNQVAAAASNLTIPTLSNVALVLITAPTPTRTATPTATGTPPTATQTPTPTATSPCQEWVVNGGLEDTAGWTISQNATLTDQQVHGGDLALRLGIVDGPNVYSYSSATQLLTLPTDAAQITLSFWYYPLSGDLANDLQMVRIYENGELREGYLYKPSDQRQWLHMSQDLSAYRGRTILLYLGVRNDGQGGTTAMYLDDVSVRVCGVSSHTPTWTPTATRTRTPTISPTPLATPTPTAGTREPGCDDLLANADFEEDDAWEIVDTAYPARYTEERAYAGRRALLLGILGGENTKSYSSARQLIEMPADATHIVLSFWYYPISTDEAHDRQYVLILDENNVYLEQLMWTGANAQGWLYRQYSLTKYAGQRIKVHFGVYNDGAGGTTAMYVDQASVVACWGDITPTPTPTPIFAHRIQLPRLGKGEDESWTILSRDPGVVMPARMASEETEIAAPEVVPQRWPLPMAATSDPLDLPQLALDEAARRVYVVANGRIAMLDADDGTLLATRAIGRRAQEIAVDPARQRLYISERENDQLWMLDSVSLNTVAVIAGIPQPGQVAFAGDRVYVTATASDELYIINADTTTVEMRLPVGRAPYAVAADSTGPYLLVANAGAGTVTAINRFDNSIAGVVSLGGLGYPQDIAVDTRRSVFYVAYAISPTSHAVAILKAPFTTGQIMPGRDAYPLLGAYGLAFDPVADHLYVMNGVAWLALQPESGRLLHTVQTGTEVAFPDLVVDWIGRTILVVGRQRASLEVWRSLP